MAGFASTNPETFFISGFASTNPETLSARIYGKSKRTSLPASEDTGKVTRGSGNEAGMREVWRRDLLRRPRVYMRPRVHVLRRVHRENAARLPELRRRIGATPPREPIGIASLSAHALLASRRKQHPRRARKAACGRRPLSLGSRARDERNTRGSCERGKNCCVPHGAEIQG